MSRSSKARKKFEKISNDKSNAYLHNSPQISTVYDSGSPKKKSTKKKQVGTQPFKKESQKEVSERFRKQLVSRATRSELTFKKFLDNQMVAYQFQKIVYVSIDCEQKFYIADFFFKRYNLIVELDGEYHYTEEQKKLDDIRTMHLRRAGYFVLRFDNSATDNSKEIYNEIINFIEEKFGKI